MGNSLNNLCSALDRLTKLLNNLTEAFKALSEATKVEMVDKKSNNWRKLHGLPMRRRKSRN